MASAPLAPAPVRQKMKKRNIPNWVRRDVCRRYGAEPGTRVAVKCHYCDHVGEIHWMAHYPYWPTLDLEFDHYIPESGGGLSDPSNIVLACRRCNRSKKDKVPTEPLILEITNGAD